MFLCTSHIQFLANNRFAIVMCQDSEKTSNLDQYFIDVYVHSFIAYLNLMFHFMTY